MSDSTPCIWNGKIPLHVPLVPCDDIFKKLLENIFVTQDINIIYIILQQFIVNPSMETLMSYIPLRSNIINSSEN